MYLPVMIRMGRAIVKTPLAITNIMTINTIKVIERARARSMGLHC